MSTLQDQILEAVKNNDGKLTGSDQGIKDTLEVSDIGAVIEACNDLEAYGEISFYREGNGDHIEITLTGPID